MPQIIECPKCAKKLSAPEKLAGMQVACPACTAPVSIPSLKTSATQSATSRPAAAASLTPPAASFVQCPHCNKKFKGAPELQGKSINCPVCKNGFIVRLQTPVAKPPVAPAKTPPVAKPMPTRPPGSPNPPVAAKPQPARFTPLTPNTQPKPAAPIKSPAKSLAMEPAPKFAFAHRRPRMLYLVFGLAFVPLTFQTLGSQGDLEERFTHTFAAHPEIEPKLENVKSKADLFALFPDGRIEGAHLSYFTRVHWAYATVAALAFFGICWLLFEPGKASIPQWFIVFAVTATVGIVSLLAFQWMAEITQGVWITGRGVLVLLFYIVKFIGFSYSAASDKDTGFLLSLFGFTFGVGLCEEITKALPVIVWLGEDKKLDWRAACILGLASGIGFGVVEGIIYAGDHYNGVMSADIYLTRFISCVALHATWTAAVALMAVRNLGGFNTSEATDYALHMLMIISVPAILHGLYDTLLKKGFDGYALLIALASFAWLAFLVERARSQEETTPRRAIRVTA